jgi:hypothetical protein
MKWRMTYHLMRADFLERVRSYGFLGMLLFTIFVTYIFIPAPESIQIAGLELGGYRSLYNSAWIGSMTTLLMGEFFLLFAFYFLKGSIERDRQTGVGQIIATTPITKSAYTLGKWLSNVAVITAMVAIIIAASAALQFIRGEDTTLNLWALASPFILVLLPALMVIAATAVLFDSVNWLRGALGNVLFFFIAYPLLTLLLDLAGNSIIYPSIYQACAAQFSGCNPTRQIDAGLPPLMGLPIFQYDGVHWTLGIIAGRLGIILIGALIALLASRFFHRFDPAKDGTSSSNVGKRQVAASSEISSERAPISPIKTVTLTPILSRPHPNAWQGYGQLIKAEIKLIFKGVGWLWYVFAFCVVAGTWLLPLDSAHLVMLPMAWVLPLTLWSGLGTREARYSAGQVVFSAPFPLRRQLPATWLVGVLIALVMGSGVILRYLIAGQWISLLAVTIGALFIPSLALAMGIWSGGSKLFEGLYLFVWYLASVISVPPLDFMGRLSDSLSSGLFWRYAGLTLLLIALAVIGRSRQVTQ